MATFGHYQADRLLHRAGLTAVYAAAPAQSGSSPRIIKVHESAPHDEALQIEQTQAFLDSAAIQQKAAQHDPQHWAAIHEFGATTDGGFYVADRYDFSAQQLVDGRINLSPESLHNLVRSIVEALGTLSEACGRPHGDLKFSNILLTRPRDMSRAQVVLCDPLPDRYLDAETHAKADLQQIGELIHQLVLHHSSPQIQWYHAPDSPEWRKLGQVGSAWRELCNHLLLVDAEDEPFTLEDLAARLTLIAPKRSSRTRKLGMYAGMVLAVLVVGILVGWYVHYQRIREAEGKEILKKDWYWVKVLNEQVLEHPRLRALETDEDKQNKASKRRDWNLEGRKYEECRRLVEQDEDLEPILANIPLADPNADNSGDTKFLERLKEYLFDPNNRWPRYRMIAKQLADANCTVLADYVNERLNDIKAPESADDTTGIDALATAFGEILDLAIAWHEHEIAIDYAHLDAAEIRKDKNLCGGLQVKDTADFIARIAGDRNDPDNGADGLGRYYRLTAGQIGRIEDQLAVLREEKKSLERQIRALEEHGESQAAAAGLRKRMEDEIDPSIEEVANTARIRGNRQKIRVAYYRAMGTITLVWQDPNLIDPAKWWAATATREMEGSQAIRQEWRRRRDYWLAPENKTRLTDRAHYTEFLNAKSVVDATCRNLGDLNKTLVDADGLRNTMSDKNLPEDWLTQLCDAYRTRIREVLLDRIIQEVNKTCRLEERFPAPDSSTMSGLQWPERLVTVLENYRNIDKRLDTWCASEELVDRSSIATIHADSSERCRDVLEDPSVHAILGPLDDRVAILRRIETSTDPNSLITDETPIESVYAAWKQLSDVDPRWPSSKEQWQREADLYNRLNQRVSAQAGNRWQTEGNEIACARASARIVSVTREVSQFADGAPLLQKVGQAKPRNNSDWKALNEFIRLADNLLGELKDSGWPGNYDLEVFGKESASIWDPSTLSEQAVRSWLSEARVYRKWADCPWKKEDLSKAANTLADKIKQGLEDASGSPEAQANLMRDNATCLGLTKEIAAISQVPGVQKYNDRARIEKWSQLKRELNKLEEDVAGHIWPAEYVLLAPDDKGDLVLRIPADQSQVNSRLSSFRPVRFSGTSFTPINAKTRDKLDGSLFKPFLVTRETLQFPEFIQAQADPSVVLRLVPGNGATTSFYMSLREITNQQYFEFIRAEKPASLRDLLVQEGARADVARCAFERNQLRSDADKNAPLAWVRPEGANRYAEWIGASIPTQAQFGLAYQSDCCDKTNERLISSSSAYREQLWRFANQKEAGVSTGNPAGITEPPSLEPQKPNDPKQEPKWWPVPTSHPSSLDKICDLGGSVWEWCRKTSGTSEYILLGGSCLSSQGGPDISVSSEEFDAHVKRAKDVGFRLVVNCTQ